MINEEPVIWFTGISGAGKTTLALLLKRKLIDHHKKVQLLDGNEVRCFFENDLGYTRSERIQNVKRIAFAAKLLADNGVITVVANIAPYFEVRDFIRRHLSNYIQIHVNASLEKTRERDVKNHYRDYRNGKLTNIIGEDDKYDKPRNPDLIVNTDNENISESFNKILALLERKGTLER